MSDFLFLSLFFIDVMIMWAAQTLVWQDKQDIVYRTIVFRFPDKTMKRSAQFVQFVPVKRQDFTAALAKKSSETSLSLHIILVEIAASNGGSIWHLAVHTSLWQLQMSDSHCLDVSWHQHDPSSVLLSELSMVVSDTSQLLPQKLKHETTPEVAVVHTGACHCKNPTLFSCALSDRGL